MLHVFTLSFGHQISALAHPVARWTFLEDLFKCALERYLTANLLAAFVQGNFQDPFGLSERPLMVQTPH